MIACSHSLILSSIVPLGLLPFEKNSVQCVASPSNITVLLLFAAGGLVGGGASISTMATSGGGFFLCNSFIKRLRVIHRELGLASITKFRM